MARKSKRFDDIVRSERYFTSMLLPMILLHNDLHGLDEFLHLLDSKVAQGNKLPMERDKQGKSVVRKAQKPLWSRETVEIIAEFHIARDLGFAKRLPILERETTSLRERKKEKKDAPDLVIVLNDELVVCEGKFFGYNTFEMFNRQLRSQRLQIRYLFADRPALRAYRHIAILPQEFDTAPDCDMILTWEEVANLAKAVLGLNHYATERLYAAVSYYENYRGQPEFPTPRLIRNYDGPRLSLNDVLAKCRQYGDGISVGHYGDMLDLLGQPIAALESKKWKWRDPLKNSGTALPNNWISGTQFVVLVEQRRLQVAEAAASSIRQGK